ncbi:hypothetical protein [Paenibacillus sp. NPDC055715]
MMTVMTVMTMTIMMTMMTMFPVVMVMSFQNATFHMSEMTTFNFRNKFNCSHRCFENLLKETFFGLREMTMMMMMTMMFKIHIHVRLQFFEIEYTMEALNNRKPASDYL